MARDTIEDQILALHHKKRELAASLLEASDAGGRMSVEELLDLIRRGGGEEGATPGPSPKARSKAAKGGKTRRPVS